MIGTDPMKLFDPFFNRGERQQYRSGSNRHNGCGSNVTAIAGAFIDLASAIVSRKRSMPKMNAIEIADADYATTTLFGGFSCQFRTVVAMFTPNFAGGWSLSTNDTTRNCVRRHSCVSV